MKQDLFTEGLLETVGIAIYNRYPLGECNGVHPRHFWSCSQLYKGIDAHHC